MNKPKKRAPRVYMIEEPEVQTAAPAPPASSGNRRQRMLIRIGVLIPLVLLGFTLARGASENKHLPDSLLGVWQTTDEHYADCYMEIAAATLMFGNAERGYLLYFVSSVEETHEGGQTSYLIHYTDLDGVKYEMSLSYRPSPHETLSFKNQQKVVWNRRPA
jgi:hypothetical protein